MPCRRRRRLVVAAALAPLAAAASAPDPRWWPQSQPLAAVLLVADPRSGPRLAEDFRSLLGAMGVSVMVVDGPRPAVPPAQVLAEVLAAWRALRERQPGVPLALAGHGYGATLAIATTDALPAPEWPAMVWLLAPGREAPWVLAPAGGAPEALRRPDAALARIDAVCDARSGALVRVLLLQPERDAVVAPERARALAAAAPAATLYRVPGAGHDDLLAADEPRQRLRRLVFENVHAVRRAALIRPS